MFNRLHLHTSPKDLDPRIRRLIQRKARSMAGMSCFGPCEGEDDLRQELALRWIERKARHDPARASLHTYADRVLNTRCADLLRKAQAQKRDRRRERPLEGDCLESGGAIDAVDLRLDLNDALAAMPDSLRSVAVLFMELTEAEVIRRTGHSRQRLRTIRGKLRSSFTEWELS